MAGFILKSAVSAHTDQALNRRGIFASALDNGSVMQLLTQSADADKSKVWVATAPAATTGLQNLWMAATDGVVSFTVNGKTYRGLSNDFVRDFVNPANEIIDFFKPQVGDIIELDAAAIGGTKASNGFVVATATETKLQWAAAAVAGLTLKLIGDTFVSVGTGAIASQRVVTYKFEVVAIA